MLTIKTKELKISEELRRKFEMICRFANVKYTFENGNIKSIKETNIAYIKPHILKIKNNDYLIFEDKYYQRLTDNGFGLERGIKNSDNEHISIKEFKKLEIS